MQRGRFFGPSPNRGLKKCPTIVLAHLELVQMAAPHADLGPESERGPFRCCTAWRRTRAGVIAAFVGTVLSCSSNSDSVGVQRNPDAQPQSKPATADAEPADTEPGEFSGPQFEDPSLLDPEQPVDPQQCEREVSFEAVVLGTPPPFDVVIVADHSESLSWSREDLGQGLSELAKNVYGHSVRFYVLTPTQYDESSAIAIDLNTGDALANWRDPVSMKPYTNAVTRYVQSCKDSFGRDLICPGYPAPKVGFELEGRWEFQMPEPVAQLDSEMTPEQLEAERSKVIDAILALGTSGSPQEQPLCTLNRYIQQPPALLPERAIFLVISDEDDTASFEDCLDKYSYRQVVRDGVMQTDDCTSNCDFYQFHLSRSVSSNNLHFDCAPVDDFGMVGSEDTFESATIRVANSDVCESPNVPCSEAEADSALSECDPGYVVRNCTKQCVVGGGEDRCFQSTTQDVDLCGESFDVGGVSYANLLDYCQRVRGVDGWTDCTEIGFATEDDGTDWLSRSSVPTPLIRATSLADMIHLFHADATRALGAENYFVESIVFDEGAACMPDVGQSYATELEKIATSPEHIFPICESYAPALERVDAFARELLQTEYVVELGLREYIESVSVEGRDGATRELAPEDYQYVEDTATLHIDLAALESSDLRLSVQIVDPCARIVR